jgi:hypothetical protein
MYQVISFFFSWLAATKSKKCSSLLFPRSQEEAAYSWSSLQWIRNPKTDRSKRKKNYAGKLPCQNEKQTWHENWKKLRQFSKNADLNASVVSFEKEQIDGRQVRPLLGDNKRWITPKINIKIISQASKKQRSHLGWIVKKNYGLAIQPARAMLIPSKWHTKGRHPIRCLVSTNVSLRTSKTPMDCGWILAGRRGTPIALPRHRAKDVYSLKILQICQFSSEDVRMKYAEYRPDHSQRQKRKTSLSILITLGHQSVNSRFSFLPTSGGGPANS